MRIDNGVKTETIGNLIADRLTKKLLEKGLISQDEYDKIMTQNRKTFPPLLAEILI